MKSHIEQLKRLGACQEAVTWADQHPDMAAVWVNCGRGDWMLWLCGKLSGEPEGEERKRLVLVACDCARLALPHATDPQVLVAIETAERWVNGRATIQDVRDAANAAAYAAANAAYAAAYAAANAAANAAYVAVYAAVQKQCADIVRKHYPTAPVLP